MSLLDSIASFATGTYAVTRTAPGARALGRYTPGGESTFDIVASVQPVGGRELQALAPAAESDEVRVIYTTTELKVVGSDTAGGDYVAIDGEQWRVFKVERWQFGGATTHYRAYAALQGRP